MSSREKILARRAKFIAAAIASAGAIGCSDGTAQVCLEPAIEGGTDTKTDANADTRPMPCLDPIVDTGVSDTAPMPCLEPPRDTGADDVSPDAEPAPCLKMPFDGG
jgi:hypothetical protein